jgi:hypothetical protein
LVAVAPTAQWFPCQKLIGWDFEIENYFSLKFEGG